jgi:hypothetical protein
MWQAALDLLAGESVTSDEVLAPERLAKAEPRVALFRLKVVRKRADGQGPLREQAPACQSNGVWTRSNHKAHGNGTRKAGEPMILLPRTRRRAAYARRGSTERRTVQAGEQDAH